MPRLTLELIQKSEQGLNPNMDRQLTLRGNKIEVIENMGASQDAFTCIDLTDNGIMKLTTMPKLQRLKTLLVSNNCIKRIDENFSEGTPNLLSLVLTNNKLSMLADLNPIGKTKHLERLSLVNNPVTRLPHYREYIIWLCRNTKLRVLDFVRIRDEERKKAENTFSGPQGAEHVKQFAPPRQSAEEAEKEKLNAMDSSAVDRIKEAIVNAATLTEVTRLEKALNSLKDGKLSAEALEDLLKPQSVRDAEEKAMREEEEKEAAEAAKKKAAEEQKGKADKKSQSRSPSAARKARKPASDDSSSSPSRSRSRSKAKSKDKKKARSKSGSPRRAKSDSDSDEERKKSPAAKKKADRSPSRSPAKPKRSRSGSASNDSRSASAEKKKVKSPIDSPKSKGSDKSPSQKRTKVEDKKEKEKKGKEKKKDNIFTSDED